MFAEQYDLVRNRFILLSITLKNKGVSLPKLAKSLGFEGLRNSSLIIYMAGDKIDISAVLAHPRGPIKEPANTSTR